MRHISNITWYQLQIISIYPTPLWTLKNFNFGCKKQISIKAEKMISFRITGD